jgi:hypothetical protein
MVNELAKLHPAVAIVLIIGICAVICVFFYNAFKLLGGGWD